MNAESRGWKPDHRFWLCVLIVAQLALFYSYARREVIGAFPQGFDQAAYLEQTYGTFHTAQQIGFLGGLWHQMAARSPNGFMLQLQGVVFLLFFGPGRMSVLLLNFFYFGMFEWVLFQTARRMGGRDCFGWIAVGLLLLVQSPFIFTGGMFDFRIDHVASCLYGVFVCCLLRSGDLQKRAWVPWIAASAVLLTSFRFITFVYLNGFFLMMGAGLAGFYLLRRKKPESRLILGALKNSALVHTVWLAFTVPMIVYCWKAIRSYYVVGHLTGDEKHIRAREFGTNTLGQHLSFYLDSLAKAHLGYEFLLVAGILVAGACAGRLIGKRSKPAGVESVLPLISWWILVSALFAPWLILTANESKSPVVGSILIGPVILLVIQILARSKPAVAAPWARLVGNAGVFAVLLFGILNWLDLSCRQNWFIALRDDNAKIDQTYDSIAVFCHEHGVESPVISSNAVIDWTQARTMTSRIYETTGDWIPCQSGLGYAIFAMSREDVFKQLEKSDFMLLTNEAGNGVYPFYDTMKQLRPDITAWCDAHMVPDRTFDLRSGKVVLYINPALYFDGFSGDWITTAPVTAKLTPHMLAWLKATGKMSIVLEGTYLEALPHMPDVAAELTDADGASTPTPLRVKFEKEPGLHYRIVISLDEALAGDIASGKEISLKLLNAYFVPSEISNSIDTRKLVVMRPASIGFE